MTFNNPTNQGDTEMKIDPELDRLLAEEEEIERKIAVDFTPLQFVGGNFTVAKVMSESDAGLFYVVGKANDSDTVICSCPSFRFRETACKHIKEAFPVGDE